MCKFVLVCVFQSGATHQISYRINVDLVDFVWFAQDLMSQLFITSWWRRRHFIMCIEICYLWAIHRYYREVMKSDRTLRLILYNTFGYLIFQWRKRFNPFGFFRISIFTYIDHTQSLMTKWINCICFCFFSFYLFRRH